MVTNVIDFWAFIGKKRVLHYALFGSIHCFIKDGLIILQLAVGMRSSSSSSPLTTGHYSYNNFL